MRIEYLKDKSKEQPKFDTVEPGTVARFKGETGPVLLKLKKDKAVVLSWFEGSDALSISDGSIEENNPDCCEILGKLVGIIIE